MEEFENELVAKYKLPVISHIARMVDIELPRDHDSDQFTIPLSSLPSDSTQRRAVPLCNIIQLQLCNTVRYHVQRNEGDHRCDGS